MLVGWVNLSSWGLMGHVWPNSGSGMSLDFCSYSSAGVCVAGHTGVNQTCRLPQNGFLQCVLSIWAVKVVCCVLGFGLVW